MGEHTSLVAHGPCEVTVGVHMDHRALTTSLCRSFCRARRDTRVGAKILTVLIQCCSKVYWKYSAFRQTFAPVGLRRVQFVIL
jgi:hypothetical protein